ncbi:MAG: GAF domain-containing SpoIIE family protein phosphatase [Mariprofundales bacterium]
MVDQRLRECTARNRRLSKALEANRIFARELHLGALLESIMRVSQDILESEACSLFLIDEENGDLLFYVALGSASVELKELYRVPQAKGGIAGWVAEHGQSQLVNDVYADPRFNPEYDQKTGFQTNNIICVPVHLRGEITAVIEVINHRSGRFTHEELNTMEMLSDMIGIAIDNARAHAQLLQQRQLDHDLKLARQLQESFLPQIPPPASGFDIAFINLPALMVSGDFYDSFLLPDGRMALLLGDVSGKGIAAALMMTKLLSEVHHNAALSSSPAAMLQQLNHTVCTSASQGMFVTLVIGLLELDSGHVQLANAGHLPALLYQDHAVTQLPGASGPPLGIDPQAQFSEHDCTIHAGDALLFYSDGITEVRNPEGGQFGVENLHPILMDASSSSSDTVLRRLLDRANRHRDGGSQQDDMTMLMVRRPSQGKE